MCESYSRWLLRVSVAQVCQALGWDAVQLSACDLLTDVLQRYLHSLGRGCRRYCELYGRTDPILEDVGEAFKLMGVSLHELEDYILNIEPVTFAHQIPAFPVSKNNVLQFPQPGSKDAEERKEYIPDYMPPIVSSQEEEEEEQVPTDGGTSAEAMQVPLEEEGEMEEDEAVNDENYLSKRPLESPESEEMPAIKRPKLAPMKGDALDGAVEPREPLSSINAQKVPPMLSPVCVQVSADLVPPSPEPPILAPIAKSQLPVSKPLESRAFAPKAKVKTSSPGQKTKMPKVPPSPAVTGSPIRSPKTGPKEKKSPGRTKSPRSPKSPKVPAHAPPVPPAKPETPSRTPLAALSEKMGKENIQVKQGLTPADPGKPHTENPTKKVAVTDKTIDDSIDAVIARACAERDPDPFEFSSGSESEGDIFTSPKRISVSETTAPKASVSANSSLNKAGSTPVPPSGGTSSSDISWTMDDSIDEVIRKANMGIPANLPSNFPYFSSPSASPPTPEPLLKVYEEKTKLASSVEVKKKLKKEPKTKMKKKEKQKDKEKIKEKNKDKEKNKEKDKDKEGGKDSKFPWKNLIRDDNLDAYKYETKDFDDDPKVKVKDGSTKKDREKHKDKKKEKEKGKKDKEKKDKQKVKDKNKDKVKAPLVLPAKDLPMALFSTPAMKLPSLMPPLSSVLPEKLFEEKEKPKEKKKDKKEKKKKKEREKDKEKEKKEKEKEKKEREKKEKEKEKHKHEKIKVEPVVPAPSHVIPRLTLKVGAGQDKIVISKVVSTPEAKPSALQARPKTPPPPAIPAPAPIHVTPPPPPVVPPLPPATISPALIPPLSPAVSAVGGTKPPVRSVVTETVSNYVIRDEWGNKIWICPGCEKPDDGSPMIGCDDCDDWYHWPCVGITAAPPEEMQWFCSRCASKKKDKKHKKWKHKAH
ncbi:transcription initiation factor TFIID subunit 3 isoform X2 [Varanus komodoensis]|uniref:transcription initiation factor TFIID subunit 3 isoform X2 n=1 Tax=Varanus komodoensis TaxID=61221 RepID=UPI001CF77AB6|nr:transcription initiation factor TFIID subunit 3 isoform X2 [Varanus komodoensis]